MAKRSRAPRNSDPITEPTRTGRFNAVIVSALVVLALVVVFIAQNSKTVNVTFLGFNGHISLGVALLVGFIAGGLTVALFGSGRILQMRHRARKAHNNSTEPAVDLTSQATEAPETQQQPQDPLDA